MSKSLAVVVGVIVVVLAALAFYMAYRPGGAPSSVGGAVTTAVGTSTTVPQLSGSLTVLVPTGDPTLMPYVRMAADEFSKRYPGVKITIQPVPYGQMVQTALTALQNKNPDPAVIIFYPSQASTLGPYLMDLTPYFNKGVFNSSDLPMSAMTAVIMLSSDGNITKIFGVPFQMVFGYVLVYRKSIFENQALREEFRKRYGYELDPSTWSSWDQLIQAAEFLQSRQVAKYALLFPDGLQQSIFNGFIGIFYTYAMADPCVDIPKFEGAAPTQGYWAYFKMTPQGINITVGCPSFLQALKTYKRLIQFQPPITVQAMEYDQLRDLFLTGDYAMVAAWTSFIPIYNNATLSKVAGDIAIAPLPGGKNPFATGLAPTFIGINPYAKDPDLAARFIAFMMSPEMYRKGAEKVGFVPGTVSGLRVASEVPSMSWVKPFIPLLEAKISQADLTRLTLVNRVTNFFTDLRPYFINEVAKYLRGEQDAETTQQNIYRTWKSIAKIS